MIEFLVLLSIMLESSYKWQSNSRNVTEVYFWYRYEWEHQYTSSSLSNQKPEGKRPKTAPAADPKGEEVKVKTNSIKLKHEISICSFFVHGTNQSSLYLDQKMLFFYLTILRKHSLGIFFFQTADSMNIYWTFLESQMFSDSDGPNEGPSLSGVCLS